MDVQDEAGPPPPRGGGRQTVDVPQPPLPAEKYFPFYSASTRLIAEFEGAGKTKCVVLADIYSKEGR